MIAIDGKTARGSRDNKNGRSPLHMVSAWAGRNRLLYQLLIKLTPI